MLKLRLTDEEGTLIKEWQSDDQPEVFQGLRMALADAFAATSDVLELIDDACSD
jgi:hypothetical protein